MTISHDPSTSAREKTYEIVVNGRSKTWSEKEISYSDLVNLAYSNKPPTGDMVVITVTYSKGEDRQQGSLLPGDSVKVKDGMIFDVTGTVRS